MSIKLKPQPMQVDNGRLMALEGTARLLQNNSPRRLYRAVNPKTKPIPIKLIPYYAWANRGYKDMTVMDAGGAVSHSWQQCPAVWAELRRKTVVFAACNAANIWTCREFSLYSPQILR